MGTASVSPLGAPNIGTQQTLFKLISANMNITTDQLLVQQFSFSTWEVEKIIVTNASASLALAVGGFYTAASKGGTPIVAATQIFSALTNSAAILNPTLALTIRQTVQTVYLSLTTGNGSAATADIYIMGVALS